MVAPLRRVLVVRPTTVGDFAAAGWREPDGDLLRRQHDGFVALLDGLGVEVVVADAPDGLVDACFAYDPVFVTGAGAIELRMAKPARQDEPGFLASEVEKAGCLSGEVRHGPPVSVEVVIFTLQFTMPNAARANQPGSTAVLYAGGEPRRGQEVSDVRSTTQP